MNAPKILYLAAAVLGLMMGNPYDAPKDSPQDAQKPQATATPERASNASDQPELTSVENPFDVQEEQAQDADSDVIVVSTKADDAPASPPKESVYDSYEDPTITADIPTIAEIRQVVREELDRAGYRKSQPKSQVSAAESNDVPVAPKVVYRSSTPNYGSTGGSVAVGSTTYQYQSDYGSTGGSVTYAQPVRSATQSVPQVTYQRRGLFGRIFGNSNRYYVNSSGCTVDRRTGRVVSCPAR